MSETGGREWRGRVGRAIKGGNSVRRDGAKRTKGRRSEKGERA